MNTQHPLAAGRYAIAELRNFSFAAASFVVESESNIDVYLQNDKPMRVGAGVTPRSANSLHYVGRYKPDASEPASITRARLLKQITDDIEATRQALARGERPAI